MTRQRDDKEIKAPESPIVLKDFLVVKTEHMWVKAETHQEALKVMAQGIEGLDYFHETTMVKVCGNGLTLQLWEPIQGHLMQREC